LQEFFVWFLFCLCWIESACGRKLRHCTFLVCHTCPHLYPSYVILFPVSARWSFLVKKSMSKMYPPYTHFSQWTWMHVPVSFVFHPIIHLCIAD
jgi:hypothetical protein